MPRKRPTFRPGPALPRQNPGGGDPFYSGRRWRKLRRMVLSRGPLCVVCETEGKTTVADVVDHITPMRDGGAAYALENLQPLCHLHHNRKHG